jgi:hypothetical protein
MATQDLYRRINEVSDTRLRSIIERLEFRA